MQGMECNHHSDGLVRGHPWPWPAFSAVAKRERQGKVGTVSNCSRPVGRWKRGGGVFLRVHRRQLGSHSCCVGSRSRSCLDTSKRNGNSTSPVRPRCQSSSGPRQGRQAADSHYRGCEMDEGSIKKGSQEDGQVRRGACRRSWKISERCTRSSSGSTTSATSRSLPIAVDGVRVATAVASRSPSSTNCVSLSYSEEGRFRSSHRARGHGVDVGSTGGDERRSRLWESNESGTHFWIETKSLQPTPVPASMETNMVR